MSETNELELRMAQFVAHLRRLAGDGDPQQADRGALADLRSGLGCPPGHAVRMYPYVVPYLGEKADRSDRWFYVVGALFGAYPESNPGAPRSLAESFRILKERDALSDSLEMRFSALLDAHPDDLFDQLRGAISLLRTKEAPVNWLQLLKDLAQWELPDRLVQQRWARHYWGNRTTISQNTARKDEGEKDEN